MSIRKRIGLSSGLLPYLWLSLNNNSWLCIDEFAMDVMPESDEDKQAYVDRYIEPQADEKEAFETTRAIMANVVAIYWRLKTCMAIPKITFRQYLRKEHEVNPWKFSFLYRGLAPLGLATVAQSILVHAFRAT